MSKRTAPRYLFVIQILCSLILIAAALFFVFRTINWPWMWDTSVMHYVNFLMKKGQTPYRDIIDMNMPGCYFIEGWAMHLFGGSDLGWRLYEYSLLGMMTTAMIVIAWPYDWFAGLFAGVLFLLFHGSEGPRNAGQREEVMTLFIVAGYALIFEAVRRRKPLLLLPFGFLLGLAGALKPTTAPLGLLVLAMSVFALRKRGVKVAPYINFGLGGILAALLVTLDFFLRNRALGAFLQIMKRLLPYYAGMGKAPFAALLHGLFPNILTILVALALLSTLIEPLEGNWEIWALVLGICFGAVSYIAQGKTFEHHRYTFLAFVLLWLGLALTKAMRSNRWWVRGIGALGVAYGVLVIAPLYVGYIDIIKGNSEISDTLEKDLMKLGGAQLQNQVLCLDLVNGCLRALYRLDLVQNGGFMGDYMFFGPDGAAPSPYYRDLLWSNLHTNPPKVIVMTNQWLTKKNSFTKIDQWPELVNFLNTQYSLDGTRTFDPVLGGKPDAYRIYLLKNSNNLPAASMNPGL